MSYPYNPDKCALRPNTHDTSFQNTTSIPSDTPLTIGMLVDWFPSPSVYDIPSGPREMMTTPHSLF